MTDWFRIEKGVWKGYLLSSCLFYLYTEHIISVSRNSRPDESQAGIKIGRRDINNLRYADDTTLKVKRGTKEPLDEGEGGKWKNWLKTKY